MNNENNILTKNLQEHSTTPPAFLFNKIMDKVQLQNDSVDVSLKALQNYPIIPENKEKYFSYIINKIINTDILNIFKPLKDFAVSPPISFTQILKIVKGFAFQQNDNNTLAKVIKFNSLKKIAAAAAVFLLCFLGFTIYKKNNTTLAGIAEKIKPLNNNVAATTTTIYDTILTTKNPQVVATNSNQNIRKQNIILSTKFKAENKNSFLASSKVYPPRIENLKIGDRNIPVIDNDYIATFASLNENNLPAFLQADKPIATTITINDYTDITISESMGAIMKKMYKTKKSGKPTRRARKTKEKLAKWQKADADFFNDNPTNNPLNPFDLGDFILNK